MRLLLVMVALGFASRLNAADKPNVLFILADDLGINDLGCYGRKDHRTPHLDALAKAGTRFTAAYAACPVCSPTRAAVLTGMHPARLHITTFLPGRADAPSQLLLHPKIETRLPVGQATIATRLKAAGYATACVGKWHVGAGPKEYGFDTVHAGKPNHPAEAAVGGKGEFDLTDQAIAFVTANRDRPFFLYLAHNSPHIPLAARAELVAKNKDAFNPLYAAVIESMDESIGRLLAGLDELKLTEKTLVVFTSDNGGLHVPELRDDPPTHNTPYRAGKGFLYEGGIRVPAIVRGPGVPAPREMTRTFISTDWMPTLLEYCHVRAEGFDGRCLPNLLTDPIGRTRFTRTGVPEAFFWHVPHYTNQGSRPAGAVLQGRLKLIEHYEDNTAELFDLQADPGETTNLIEKRPHEVTDMRRRLTEWRRQIGAQVNLGSHPKFDPARHRRLYADTDVSKLTPAKTAAETGRPLTAWRKEMDAAAKK